MMAIEQKQEPKKGFWQRLWDHLSSSTTIYTYTREPTKKVNINFIQNKYYGDRRRMRRKLSGEIVKEQIPQKENEETIDAEYVEK